MLAEKHQHLFHIFLESYIYQDIILIYKGLLKQL